MSGLFCACRPWRTHCGPSSISWSTKGTKDEMATDNHYWAAFAADGLGNVEEGPNAEGVLSGCENGQGDA